jgi:hypothetical protein
LTEAKIDLEEGLFGHTKEKKKEERKEGKEEVKKEK